jgi:UDP-2,4-diacetamido-2,4,6-trideoxy-beta-L-altropyranose hydrolase
MRCLALAQAWEDSGGQAVFAIAEAPLGVKQRLTTEGFSVLRVAGLPGSVTDAKTTTALANQLDAAWVVVDGDRFGAAFLTRLHSSGRRILLLDDFADRPAFPAHIVVNPNLGASWRDYRDKVSRHALLLGPSYVFLRREFTSPRTQRTFPESARKILVTLGGSDPENLAPRIAHILAGIPGYEVTVVMGPGYRKSIPSNPKNHKLRILRNPTNIRQLMETADVAVIAGGGTLWELLYLGCAVLSYARNPVQQRIVEELAEKGAATHLGATQKFDPAVLAISLAEVAKSKTTRIKMAEVGRQIVDGRGALRVLSVMNSFAGAPLTPVTTVPIAVTERRQFLNIATRHFSELDSSFVPDDDWKREYFETIRANPGYFLRWILHGRKRAGFILFGIEKHRFLPRKTGMIYELYIHPAFRQRGIARSCALQAIRELWDLGPSKIQLEVLEGNTPAAALWKALRFQKVSERFVLAKDRSKVTALVRKNSSRKASTRKASR